MIGAEGEKNKPGNINVSDNTFQNDGNYSTALVDNRTTTAAILTNNRCRGSVTPLVGAGHVVAPVP
jgi:hypothetical protein